MRLSQPFVAQMHGFDDQVTGAGGAGLHVPSRSIYIPRDKIFLSKIERHFARHMVARSFGDFKGGEVFPWRNYPLRNCPWAKSPPVMVCKTEDFPAEESS